ncbi:MAG TPA: hypothetical protein VFU13_21075 [Steroidobacteraceae bacterium]|nr:hypothetical protein [Steroidobacteraceae bacterium]
MAACRLAHATDPAAHIACLEAALHRSGTTASPAEPKTDTPAGLGSEHLRDQRPAEYHEPVSVQITSATYGVDGRGVFQMSDGQVWRETETTPANLRLAPDKPYSGRIERGQFRGYRMYVDGIRRMIKVERLK